MKNNLKSRKWRKSELKWLRRTFTFNCKKLITKQVTKAALEIWLKKRDFTDKRKWESKGGENNKNENECQKYIWLR